MGEAKPIAVVFDHNIYLDIARLVDEPYNEMKMRSAVMGHRPDPDNPSQLLDAAAAVLLASKGILSGRQRMQIWSSEWIERGVENAAKRSVADDGLGWQTASAASLRQELITNFAVIKTNGNSLSVVKDISYPNLSDDDASVFHTARQALALCSKSYCVTSDRRFRLNAPNLGVGMLAPAQFVAMIKSARA